MSTPILVIHGAANRNRDQFAARVADLGGRVGADARLIPVYWGDIGGPMPGIEDTIPEILATRDMSAGPGGSGTLDGAIAAGLLASAPPRRRRAAARDVTSVFPARRARSSRGRRSIVADAAAAELTGGALPRGADVARRGPPEAQTAREAALRRAVEAAWRETTWLPLIADETVLAAIGQAIGLAAGSVAAPPGTGADVGPAGVAAVPRGGLDLGSLVGGLLGGFDRVVGSLVGGIGGTVNQLLRERVLPATVTGIGDVLMYQRHRADIFARVRSVLAAEAPGYGTRDRPIGVAGHSLGGIIAFDLAVTDPPLWIRHLVTFGSQPSALHVFDPRADGLATYEPGRPVTLPASIGAWTNVWEPLDFLAFIVRKVFVLATAAPPRDRMAEHRTADGLWTHDDYWSHPALAEALQEAATG